MAVETTEKFTCDTTRCKQSAKDRNEIMHVTVSYRLIDGSSGTEEHQFCSNHESKTMTALREAGVVTGPPQMVAPPLPPPADEDIAGNTTAKGK